jgi:hypothetical protein
MMHCYGLYPVSKLVVPPQLSVNHHSWQRQDFRAYGKLDVRGTPVSLGPNIQALIHKVFKNVPEDNQTVSPYRIIGTLIIKF